MEILTNKVNSIYDDHNTEINPRPYFYCPFKLMRNFEIWKQNPPNLKSTFEYICLILKLKIADCCIFVKNSTCKWNSKIDFWYMNKKKKKSKISGVNK